jgi:hypothetical protein
MGKKVITSPILTPLEPSIGLQNKLQVSIRFFSADRYKTHAYDIAEENTEKNTTGANLRREGNMVILNLWLYMTAIQSILLRRANCRRFRPVILFRFNEQQHALSSYRMN